MAAPCKLPCITHSWVTVPRRQVDAMNEELSAASAQLLKNDDLLSGILSGCGDCIKILDLDGRLQFMSEGGKRVMEVEDFGALKGCPWPDFWEGSGNVDAKSAVAAAKRGETARFRGAANTAKGTPRFWDVQVSPIVDVSGKPTHLLSISKDITEEYAAAERQKFLTEELRHRIKNTLTTVLAISQHSFRGTVHDDARAKFSTRILALDKANEMLTEASWQQAPVRKTVEGALAPHRTAEERFSLEGPEIAVNPQQGLALALTVNELATNALKYGSLSVPTGKVDVIWSIEPADGAPTFVFKWQEHGGPSVSPPTRQGFGTRVIKSMLASDFQGAVEISYEPSGVICILRTPTGNLRG
jgi:two-component sensor histidine kinase